MKQLMNFRLNSETIAILSLLEKKLHTSKTAVIEQALQSFARKQLSATQPLLEFAGRLSQKEADNMLTLIQSSKQDKEMDLDL